MEDDGPEEYERVICQLPSVHVFRIPVRKTAEGYRASEWPKQSIWSGRLKITAKGKVATIYLHEAEKVFARCVVSEGAVERCVDSGRYFVLRIVNEQNKSAFIGVAFNERNDAFDFNVALAEHGKEIEREAGGGGEIAALTTMRDLSLKEGEKIKKSKSEAKTTSTTSSSGNSGNFGSLNSTSSDPFGSFSKSDPFSSSDPFASTSTQKSFSDPFASSSDSFSRSDPFEDSKPASSSSSSSSSKPTSSSSAFSPSVSSNNKPNSNQAPDSYNLLDL